MINSLSQVPYYRQTWGYYDPVAIAQLAPLAYDQCYVPKYYKAPDDDQEVLAAGAYLKYGLEITPGSIWWGMYHQNSNGTDSAGFVFKITDMKTGIEVFDVPTPDLFVSNSGPGFFPWLLNSPYPIVSPGLFNVEFWNNSGVELRCQLVLCVAEVVTCKY